MSKTKTLTKRPYPAPQCEEIEVAIQECLQTSTYINEVEAYTEDDKSDLW